MPEEARVVLLVKVGHSSGGAECAGYNDVVCVGVYMLIAVE